jgi:hypothetical protein
MHENRPGNRKSEVTKAEIRFFRVFFSSLLERLGSGRGDARSGPKAERHGRMMKLNQKISGCFPPVRGTDDFMVIRTLIGTAKKTGMGYHPKPDARPEGPDQRPQSRLSQTV